MRDNEMEENLMSKSMNIEVIINNLSNKIEKVWLGMNNSIKNEAEIRGNHIKIPLYDNNI